MELQSKKARRSIDHDGSFSESGEEDFYYEEEDDDEEEDEGKAPSPTSPPTLSHRDMARPPHEDPEYQRQIVGNFKQGRAVNQYYNTGKSHTHHMNGQQTKQQLQQNNITVSCIPTSPLAHHNYTWPSPNASEMVVSPNTTSTPGHLQQQQQTSPHQHYQQQHSPAASTIIKHARCSPRPSQSTAPYPSPTYGNHHHHNHHHNSFNSSGNSSNGSSCNNSPIIHNNNNSANNVFQQLSQQNVTITPHNSQLQQQQQQQQPIQKQQPTQVSAVTITPNFVAHTQSQQQQPQTQQPHRQQTTTNLTANNIVGNTAVAQQHVAVQHTVAVSKHTPNSPNRRTRGENKKCRKVYGMERRDEWCTQCKWKKACTRFGD